MDLYYKDIKAYYIVHDSIPNAMVRGVKLSFFSMKFQLFESLE